MSPIILPGMFTLCAMLGVPHTHCADHRYGMLSYEAMQKAEQGTDPAKWYVIQQSQPGTAVPSGCDGAIAIARYRIFDGRHGTTWACRFPPKDDAINEQELGRLFMAAHRLNAIPQKTYREHQQAMAVKSMAKQIEP